MSGMDNNVTKNRQPDGTANVNDGIQQLNLDQISGQEDVAMDLGPDGDVQVEPINLEQAQMSLMVCKEALKRATGQFAALWILLDDKTKPEEERAKLQERCNKFKSERDVLQVKVDQWTAIAHSLAMCSTIPTVQSDKIDTDNNKIVLHNGGKSLTLVLDAEYPRYFHENVIKDSVAKFSETEQKQYPRVTSDALMFVHTARELAYAKMGESASAVAPRVLMILCLDARIKGMFATQVGDVSKAHWSWKRAITVFIGCALTSLEKVVAIEKFANSGRTKNESYGEYGYRLERMTEVYQVPELPQCAEITDTFKKSIPSVILNIMEIREVLRLVLEKVPIQIPDFNSLPFVVSGLKHLHGPDDTPAYQAAHEKRKRAREALEAEEESLSQSSRHKKAKFHGKGSKGYQGSSTMQNNDGVNNIPVQGHNGLPFGNRTLNLTHAQGHQGENYYDKQPAISEDVSKMHLQSNQHTRSYLTQDNKVVDEAAIEVATVEVTEEGSKAATKGASKVPTSSKAAAFMLDPTAPTDPDCGRVVK
ncbi:hypothetical protein MVEG_11238 [Podila verticillata NRRL 6337]|uniref:Uncharacterized protein n=1 Tax=Podila verticillata NRRL 6337 TaxID=1069443 RepID=A0A086TL84_9FUNG|nr:hypothetical protein MVEG_11238 [Podila verticillata NRRL 6337]